MPGDSPLGVIATVGAEPVPLEAVITTAELQRRASRPPDYKADSCALSALMDAMSSATRTGADSVLQKLVDTALALCRAHSAGISILEREGEREVFRWRAVAGVWARFLGGCMPRDKSPCGTVIERNTSILMAYPERHYLYEGDAPPIAEALLIPFHSEGKPVGTIWIIAHDETRKFDAEDHRLMNNLARFAATAYQLLIAQELRTALAAEQAKEEQLALDLDQLRRADEALREADRRKDEFLAILAHELRNPLAPVRTAVEILRLKGPPSPELQWARDVIDRQVQQLTRLIDDLMDVSRIARNKIELRKERIDLARIVQGAIETSRPLFEASGHELSVALPAEPIMVDADPMRLAQVFANVLDNAAKYSGLKGRVFLTAQRQGTEAVVSVRDEGVGIPPEMLARIFDLFTQADHPLDRAPGGLGVGLAVVKQLMEMHGGSVAAYSQGRDQGSEFVMRLPLPVSAAHSESPEPSDGRISKAAGCSRVLIVDDNSDAADALAMLLRALGYETRVANDGLAGLSAAAEFRPSAALLDIGMPKMNGYELARRVRAQPWGRDMVLIAVTGWGQPEDQQRCMESGFDHHLIKPVDPGALAKLLGASP